MTGRQPQGLEVDLGTIERDADPYWVDQRFLDGPDGYDY